MPYVCWTCGLALDTRDNYRAHFIKDHKEFDDYLICPECGEFITSSIHHWDKCHKNIPFPCHTLPIRTINPPKPYGKAIVKAQKKIRKMQHISGEYESKKNGGMRIHYRSSWERDAYTILEKAFSVSSYRGESICIPYMFNADAKTYIPDIICKMIDGTTIIVEIKPHSQCPSFDGDILIEGEKKSITNAKIVRLMNKAKWEAASRYCKIKGMSFVVWHENIIRALAKINGNSLTKNLLLNTGWSPKV